MLPSGTSRSLVRVPSFTTTAEPTITGRGDCSNRAIWAGVAGEPVVVAVEEGDEVMTGTVNAGVASTGQPARSMIRLSSS